MASEKTIFLQRSIQSIETLANLQEQISGLSGVYIARLYSTTNAITQADLDAAGINMTVADLNANVVPLLSEYLAFCGNAAVATKDRKVMMNIARRDI